MNKKAPVMSEGFVTSETAGFTVPGKKDNVAGVITFG